MFSWWGENKSEPSLFKFYPFYLLLCLTLFVFLIIIYVLSPGCACLPH